jgi:sugar phosphate isomerase/epimerase
LAAAAELGARHVLTHGVDPDRQRGAETFAAFCDLAANYSLTAEVEPVTWLEVGEFTAAAEMVRRANRPNAGVMIDSLHFFRSRSTVDQLSSVPQQWFRYVQIADAPGEIPSTLEGLLHTAREARLAPGEGDLDIAGLLRRLPNIPIALEIPNRKEVEEIGYEAHCAKIRRATERLVASL